MLATAVGISKFPPSSLQYYKKGRHILSFFFLHFLLFLSGLHQNKLCLSIALIFGLSLSLSGSTILLSLLTASE